MSRKCCNTCEYVFVDWMTDERYCEKADGEEIRLRYKHRPDWCPLLEGEGEEDEE